MMKQALKSKTILFNVFMAGVEALTASIQLIEPMVPADHFVLISIVLGMIHAMGGVYLRTVTTEPLSEK